MKSLAERMGEANRLLAPYAVPVEGTLGRPAEEPLDETRFPFQRDRDRIIHTQAFRRLKGKTQVFIAGHGDHYRTRLTHTLEVAQIARDMARTLSLNEDLAECIALAHDLGHPPFGHAGEEALDQWMGGYGKRFEHNRQSHRIVTLLECHTRTKPGLNLNREVLEGLQKHRTPHDISISDSSHSPTLEAQVVNFADEIAYTCHDVDDGLRAGLFSIQSLGGVPLATEAQEQSSKRGTFIRSGLIHLLVLDLYAETEKRLALEPIQTLDDVYGARHLIVAFSQERNEGLEELRAFLWNHVYMNEAVQIPNTEGQQIVLSLCTRYAEDPPSKVLDLQKRTESSLEEAIVDYVSGMTDRFAVAATNRTAEPCC